MKRHLSRRTISVILLLSGFYFVILCTLLYFLHSLAVPLMGIIFVSYISWRKGTIPGLLLTALNHICNGIAFRLFAPEFLNSSHQMVISIAVHTGISILLGYFGGLALSLREEIERRKQVEASLRSLQNGLEQRVEERTHELEKANELLYQARKMETIGNIAGTIAHDFNNFLTIISGYSTLIVKSIDQKEPAYEYAQVIEKTAETAAELTSQLLTFARKKKFTIQTVDLNILIKEMIPLLSSVIKHGITINHIAEPQLPTFQGGIDQIKSAILNLCLNARDAMKNGGILTLTTKILQITPEFCQNHSICCQAGTYTAIEVSDTGSGIEDEVLNHLFEPFFTTKEVGKGTGMGLAAVYGIMQSHRGAVFADTKIGNGTSFTMLFPIE